MYSALFLIELFKTYVNVALKEELIGYGFIHRYYKNTLESRILAKIGLCLFLTLIKFVG